MFKSLNNATIKNLVIENFKSTGLRATSYNGIICNNATNSNIENVVISGEFAERVGFVIGTGRNVNINGLMLFIKSSSSFINNVIGKNFENCYLNNFAIISNSDIRVNNFTSKSNEEAEIYSMISVLWKAVQEQQKEIEELKKVIK